MNKEADCYEVGILRQNLKFLDCDLKYRRTLKSTMDFPVKKKKAKTILVLTDHQTAGRGRHQNYWQDEAGGSILLTIFEEVGLLEKISLELLSHLIAIQLLLALEPMIKTDALQIKWPNDIFLAGRKIGGILLEQKDGHLAIGVGVNIYAFEENAEMSLLQKPQQGQRQKLVLKIVENWHNLKKEIKAGLTEKKMKFYQLAWKQHALLLGRKIFLSLHKRTVLGVVKKVLLGGGLVLKTEAGLVKVSQVEYAPGSCILI